MWLFIEGHKTCKKPFFLIQYVYWCSRNALEVERTKNATATLDSLLENYDNRLRPKFGGNQSFNEDVIYRVSQEL